ncbi:beta-lactamase family protein [Herbiconiux moechotypicola]|uniref:Serine hydrolase domain-containing protein n=1 Tax=Herbiconiux moechotypicola TaxID=637393 RepID=A0ABP5R0J3_9MICO|nr:serine hydrolase domain-containing protein [Herbiconiux moechotypicola]MCS5731812.1 beta-lactamase family protein [Herbiconiux moechotypicola]
MIRRALTAAHPLLVLPVSALLLAGCTVGTPTSSSAVPTPSATAGGDAARVYQTLAPLDRDGLVSLFESTAEDLGQAGAALLLRTPEGEVTATFGTTTRGGDTPVSIDDHIRVGSNTKTWTGTVILQLVGEGRIALDDPVSLYRPDVPNGENITIEQLLTMRSGLFNYTETYELNAAMDDEPERVWNPEELVAIGLSLPPYFAPGEGWHYSNTNTVLLGLIAEQLDGKPLPQIFENRLFGPLGLDETSLPALDDAQLPEPRSDGYYWWTNVGTMSNPALPADLFAAAEAGTLQPNDSTVDNPSWAWSAGAGISTATDLADWVEALGGKPGTPVALLDPELQQARLDSIAPTTEASPDTAGAPAAGYGWGLARLGPFFGHTGELPGYNSFMGYDPVNDVTLVVWANVAPAADGRAPASTIALDLVDEVYAD